MDTDRMEEHRRLLERNTAVVAIERSRQKTHREVEQAVREFRAEVEPYQRQLVDLYSMAMPSFRQYQDGTIERGAPT